MKSWDDIIQLAKILETEWAGGHIDRTHARQLAEKLLPNHPEIHNTLQSVRRRMTQG